MHIRTQIRKAAVAALNDAGIEGINGGQVIESFAPVKLQQGLHLSVNTNSERSELASGSVGGRLKRNITIQVNAVQSGTNEELPDIMDDLATLIEPAFADNNLAGALKVTPFLVNSAFRFEVEGSDSGAFATWTFEAVYFASMANPTNN